MAGFVKLSLQVYMKKIALLILILIAVMPRGFEFQLRNNLTSGLNPYDHIILSNGITLVFSMVFEDMGKKYGIGFFRNPFIRALFSSICVYLLCSFKENVMDAYSQTPDMNANILGIGTAVITVNIFNLIKRSGK